MRQWALAAVLVLAVPSLGLARSPKHQPSPAPEPAPLVPAPKAEPTSASKPSPALEPAPLVPAPKAEPPRAPKPSPAPSAPEAPWLYAGVRAGMTAPFQILRPGWEAGAQARMALPVLDGRLSAGLYLGALQAAGTTAALIPGRGYDPALLQNRLAGEAELSAEYALLDLGPHSLGVGLAYGLYLVNDRIEALGSWTSESGLGSAAIVSATYRMALGPGRLGVVLRAGLGAAALGGMSAYGTRSVSGASLSLSYELSFLHQENPR